MPIWKLEPTTKESEHRERSRYKGPVIVRAPNEQAARHRAAQVFFTMAVRKTLGAPTPFPPWQDFTLVACTRMENPAHTEEGPTRVLEPSHYDDE